MKALDVNATLDNFYECLSNKPSWSYSLKASRSTISKFKINRIKNLCKSVGSELVYVK